MDGNLAKTADQYEVDAATLAKHAHVKLVRGEVNEAIRLFKRSSEYLDFAKRIRESIADVPLDPR